MRRLVARRRGDARVAAALAQAATPGFRYGVAAGEITLTSAVLWTRAPSAGRVSSAVVGRPGAHDLSSLLGAGARGE